MWKQMLSSLSMPARLIASIPALSRLCTQKTMVKLHETAAFSNWALWAQCYSLSGYHCTSSSIKQQNVARDVQSGVHRLCGAAAACSSLRATERNAPVQPAGAAEWHTCC